jgi:DNA-binding NtrC family response regulator
MKGRRILIVEDEGILARGLEVTLAKSGYVVAGVARTGREAIEKARESSPDLVLMDVRLGEGAMDGVEAADLIRAEQDVPVIYLTAFADDETLRRAKATGPHGYLVKPFDERLLLITIEMALFKRESEQAIQRSLDETKRANRELEFQKGYLETLFESIPCGLLVVDRNERIRSSNVFFREMLGIPEASLVGRLPGEVLGCEYAVGGTAPCGQGECAESCAIMRSIARSFGGEKLKRVSGDFRLSADGETRDVQLLVSSATVDYEGERLSILILEDAMEVTKLRRILKSGDVFAGIIGSDLRMQEVFATIREVADSTVPVLIEGESGTGKEMVAAAIHNEGCRSGKHFVAVNCGAIPDGLLESELFGHVKGAFTGAIRDRKGRFELAHEGTLFLDEIGEIGPAMQVKLLRVLQTQTFERVGSEQTIQVSVRIIAATNRELLKEVAAGRFRRDLYYRLAVMPIFLPPLRERRDDVPLLVDHLLKRIAAERGVDAVGVSPEAMARLVEYSWPGNVRELENVLQYALLKSGGEPIRAGHLPPSVTTFVPKATFIRHARKLSQESVARALEEAAGNKVKAARILGVSRATLYRFFEEETGGPA